MLTLLFSLILVTSCQKPPQVAPPTRKVTVSPPQTMSVTNWDEYPGRIEAVESVDIRPRVSGYIDSIHFDDGAEVKAGELLFVIDPKPYQAEVDRTKAERQRAETRLELAQNDLKRAEGLRGSRAISEEEFDMRSKTAREAESALTAVKAAEAAAQLNLEYTRVKAPIAGRISRRYVTAGNLVQGGGAMQATLLTRLITVDPVYCYFDVEESTFIRYRRGLGESSQVKDSALPCELALVSDNSFPHKGRVDFYENQVDAATGTIRLRAVLSNPDRALVPGMFAKIRVAGSPPTDSMLVPAVALMSDQGQKYLFLVNKDNVVERRDVQIGRQQGVLKVVDGLKKEDRVVVNGQMLVRIGAKVEIAEATAKAAAPVKN